MPSETSRQATSARSMTSRRRVPHTTSHVRDRRGRAARVVSVSALRKRPGAVIKDASKYGMLVLEKGGEPIAVMLSAEELLAILLGLPT